MPVVVAWSWWWYPGAVVVVGWWWRWCTRGGGIGMVVVAVTLLEHVESRTLDSGVVVVLTVQQHYWAGHGSAEGQYRYTVRWYCNEYRPNMGSGVAYGRDNATARRRGIEMGRKQLTMVVDRINNGTGA